MPKKKWTRYLTPGLVFQSVLIGGGYGTGAEIACYFGRHGLLGGLLALGGTAAAWAVLCSVTFEFARVFRTYDYGSMMRRLLGPAGRLYDLCFCAMLLLVLGVVNATAGAMVHDLTGAPPWVGVALLSGGVVLLVLRGTEAIVKALSLWAYLLYAVYLLFLASVFLRFGDAIIAELARAEAAPGWLASGLKYACYNLLCVSMILYTLRDLRSRREAVACGILAGLLGAAPAAALLLAMGCGLPAALASETPVTAIFQRLGQPWLYILFEIVLFGTLVETAAGFIKALEDRLEQALARAPGPSAAPAAHRTARPRQARSFELLRPLVTGAVTALGICVSTFGLTELIDKGYGAICYGALFLFALPMLTVGAYKLKEARRR